MKDALILLLLSFGLVFDSTAQNLLSGWAANGSTDSLKSLPNNNGWGCTTPNLAWGPANTTQTVVRYFDYNSNPNYSSTSTIQTKFDGAPFMDRIMLLRWDNGGNSTVSSIYTLKLGALDPNRIYKFKWKYAYFNNGSAYIPLKLFTKIVNSRDGVSGICRIKNFTCSLTNGLLQSDSLYFNPENASDTLFLSIAASAWSICSIADLTLEETTLQPRNETIEVQTPGSLSSLLAAVDYGLVDTLKISGTIDARDFESLNSAITCDVLEGVDWSNARIAAYSGTEGTLAGQNDYAENSIPANAHPRTTLIKSIVLPNTATTICKDAFSYCLNVQKIIIPNSISTIEDGAFLRSDCFVMVEPQSSYLFSEDGVLFNKSKTTLMHCTNLKMGEFNIPNTVTSLGYGSFKGCKGLTKVTLPETLKAISNSTFDNCTNLTCIRIPSLVSTIGDFAFSNCVRLDTIYCDVISPIDLSNSSSAFFGNNKTTCKLYIPSGTYESYVNSTGWNSFLNILEPLIHRDGYTYQVNGIGTVKLMKGNVDDVNVSIQTGITSSQIDYSITEIDDFAFYNFVNLTTITVPNSITKIGNSAFQGCIGLTEINLPITMSFLGSSSFQGCTGLTTIVIPDSISVVGNSAFSDCQSINTVYMNAERCSGMGSLTYPIFSGCLNLKKVVLGENVSSLPSGAFFGCSVLVEISIPATVTSIGNYAFYGCSGLKNFTLPSQITQIGSSAFQGCIGLTNITIPASVTSIGGFAFKGCTSLSEVNFLATNYNGPGNPLSSIFSGCINIKTIEIGDHVTSIPSYLFGGCAGVSTITIPNSVTSIGNFAFAGCTGLSSIYSYSETPITLSSSSIFNNVNKSTCILYVPKGTINLYQSAGTWKTFVNIVEFLPSVIRNPENSLPPFNYDPLTGVIQFMNLNTPLQLEVYDLNGILVKKARVENRDSVSLHSLRKGFYLLKLLVNGVDVVNKKVLLLDH